jgi:ATPase subunit of ABC transporter with duplicated ATPase domains
MLDKTYEVNEDLPVAIEVKGATFTWDTPPTATAPGELDGKNKTEKQSRFSSEIPSSKNNANVEATISANAKSQVEKVGLQLEAQTEDEDWVFQVRDISMEIPRGMLVAVVGPVGSGKTSLLQGLIGEMRKTSGSITFGGSVGYCPQSAWIQVGAGFFDSEWLIEYLYRMRLLGRIFVSDVLLNLGNTGRQSETRVWSLIYRCYLMGT